MQKRKAVRTLSRVSSQKRALLRTLLVGLAENEKIETTLAKAKELRPFAERMITRAKRGLDKEKRVAATRLLKKDLPEAAIENIFKLAEKMKDRAGGYTRIIKKGARSTDFAPMAMIAWTEQAKGEEKPKDKDGKKEDKKDKK